MNLRSTALSLAYFAWVVAAGQCLPLAFAFFEDQTAFDTLKGFTWGVILSAVVGLALWVAGRGAERKVLRKEALFVIAAGWIMAGLLGSVPFVLSGAIPGWLDAVFESVSGFTTTGSSILTNVEILPRSVLFWRSFTHWLGGVGIVVLFLTFLPTLGITDRQLFRIEATGIAKVGLMPRTRGTGRALWLIYTGLTAVVFLLLWVGGMPAFDSLCHSFGAVATGGFSTKNASIGHYGTYVHLVITLAMFAGGVNFALYFAAFRGRFLFRRDPEFKFYLLLLIVGTLLATVAYLSQRVVPFGIALRDSLFTVTSILTCTGYATADFEQWLPFAQILLVLLAFTGGCVGSTAGGIKVVRVLVTLRWAWNQVVRHAYPLHLRPTRLAGEPVVPDIEHRVVAFTVLYLLWWLLGVMVLLAFGSDIVTSIGASVAVISNCGPGLGAVGPCDNFSALHPVVKGFLAWLMVVGRLEILTVSVLLTRAFWRQ